MIDKDFREKVFDIMRQVPLGKVVTYGDVAVYSGHPYAARIVGGIAHFGDVDLPWHRLVNRFGGLASGFPGGREIQAKLLEEEGIKFNDLVIKDFESVRWKKYER